MLSKNLIQFMNMKCGLILLTLRIVTKSVYLEMLSLSGARSLRRCIIAHTCFLYSAEEIWFSYQTLIPIYRHHCQRGLGSYPFQWRRKSCLLEELRRPKAVFKSELLSVLVLTVRRSTRILLKNCVPIEINVSVL